MAGNIFILISTQRHEKKETTFIKILCGWESAGYIGLTSRVYRVNQNWIIYILNAAKDVWVKCLAIFATLNDVKTIQTYEMYYVIMEQELKGEWVIRTGCLKTYNVVFKSTGCTVGICMTITFLQCLPETKILQRSAILSVSYKQ